MGSRYLFIVLYVWLEKMLTRGDYHRRDGDAPVRRGAAPSRDLPLRRRASLTARPLRRPGDCGLTTRMPGYSIVTVPAGDPIRIADGKLQVPDHPIIPFIEGDGTGPDIWRASQRVFDAAVQKAYGGKRQIAWMEVSPARRRSTASRTGCPTRRSTAFKEYLVGIKGPLTTPIGGGIRSLNVDAAPDARPLRLPAPGALLHGRAEPGEAARAGRHGDLPREHRGHLRRHRVGGGERRGAEGDRVPRRTRWA